MIINMRTGSTATEDWIFQSKSITPNGKPTLVQADSGYDGLSEVVVYGDPDLIASNIRSGVTIFGVRGTY